MTDNIRCYANILHDNNKLDCQEKEREIDKEESMTKPVASLSQYCKISSCH